MVGFQFHLQYLTPKGTPTNCVIAAGQHDGERNPWPVNVILGLLFITQTKTVIHTSYCMEELCAFVRPSFPFDFHRTMCAIPVIKEKKAAANAALHANIVK
jgi:hypothetical protein